MAPNDRICLPLQEFEDHGRAVRGHELRNTRDRFGDRRRLGSSDVFSPIE